jgi:bleomycin hydrolase
MGKTLLDKQVSEVLTPEMISSYQAEFQTDPRNKLLMNFLSNAQPSQAMMQDRMRKAAANHIYSHMIKTLAATNQKGSGRCWMYAGQNVMRQKAAVKFNLENFEFSQNYTMFWDKMEKSNFFLETILKTLDEPNDSRLLKGIMGGPVEDGGQWHMLVNVLNKYGVVPADAMPETDSSSNTGTLSNYLTSHLRNCAINLRDMYRKGAKIDELHGLKDEMLANAYKILVFHLTEPPKTFSWQYRDKDDKFVRIKDMTPQEFTTEHMTYDFNSKVCLIHCPMNEMEFNKVYTIEHLGNVVGGDMIRYVNVSMDIFRKATLDQILDDEPVWFGCDCGPEMDREFGYWDVDMYSPELFYGEKWKYNKAQRLEYGMSSMNHAMVFTGVDLDDDGKPLKWRVENSWGTDKGNAGFFCMTDRWFEEYNYEVAVDKKYLPQEVLDILDMEPIVLPRWHPMGTLAL